jgi:hypothetical protein
MLIGDLKTHKIFLSFFRLSVQLRTKGTAQASALRIDDRHDSSCIPCAGAQSHRDWDTAYRPKGGKIKSAIEKCAIDGHTWHPTEVFQTFEAAMARATIVGSSIDRP